MNSHDNLLPPQILRDDTFEENIKEGDELASACTNIFNSILSKNEDSDIETALATLQDLQNEMPLNEIRSQIKKQIMDDLNELQTKQPSISFPYFIHNIFEIHLEEVHPLKESLDLYKESLQEVIEEHILHQIKVTFAPHQPTKVSLIAFFTDFFNTLKVSPLEDDEKNRILIEMLQGFISNDYAKIIDLKIDFGFIKWTKYREWLAQAGGSRSISENPEEYNAEQKRIQKRIQAKYKTHQDQTIEKWKKCNYLDKHLDSTLTQIQSHLRKFQRFTLDKNVKAQENEIFYKEVTHWKLLRSCEDHLNYLYDLIKSEIKRGKDIHNFYQFYFVDNKASKSKVEILLQILIDYKEDSKVKNTGLFDALTEKIFQALQSFEKVSIFYQSIKKDTSFTSKTINTRKNEIEELKKDLESIAVREVAIAENKLETIPENKIFIDLLKNNIAADFKPDSNYLQALVDKSLSLNILQQQKKKQSVKIAPSWPEVDETKLKAILQNMGKQLTVQTFMQALIENERKGTERVRISNQCINDFVEYLSFMEEIFHFQVKLSHLSKGDEETAKLMMTHELKKMPAPILNKMLEKIQPYCVLATQYSKVAESSVLTQAKETLQSIAECIEKIKTKRYAEGGVNKRGQVIPETIRLRSGLRYAFKHEKVKEGDQSVFVLGEQKNRDAVFTLSRLSYMPKPSYLEDQKTTLNQLKTVNALKTSCKIFNTQLKNRIVSLIPNEFKNLFTGSRVYIRNLDNFLKPLDFSPHDELISEFLLALNENKQLITDRVKNIEELENALKCYTKELPQLQALLEEENPPYERLLAFEAQFSQSESLFQQENTPDAQKFLAAIQEKQDSSVVLHHACNVFEKEMGDKVKTMLLNESKKCAENQRLYNSYENFKDEEKCMIAMLKSYRTPMPNLEDKALKKLLAKNEELAVTLQKYEIAADMKHHLSYYRKRPQVAMDIFERKLKRHTTTLKKYEDGPVTKFFQAIARAFGFVPKPTPKEAFYAKAKSTLFAAGSNPNLVKEPKDLQKTSTYRMIV